MAERTTYQPLHLDRGIDAMDLQIRERLEHQHRVWVFERVGWGLLALVLLAAVLGLFGPGIFGTARASAPNGQLSVEYLRFLRARAPQHLRIVVEPQSRGAGRFELWLDAAYLDGVTLQHITPEPETMRVGAERVTFEFAWDETAGAVPLSFELKADDFGPLRGRIGHGAAVVEMRQFVYP